MLVHLGFQLCRRLTVFVTAAVVRRRAAGGLASQLGVLTMGRQRRRRVLGPDAARWLCSSRRCWSPATELYSCARWRGCCTRGACARRRTCFCYGRLLGRGCLSSCDLLGSCNCKGCTFRRCNLRCCY